MRVMWLVMCSTLGAGIRLSKRGSGSPLRSGANLGWELQEEGGGNHYVIWQPKGSQISLSPAMRSTYKDTQGLCSHGRQGRYPFETGPGKGP